ncbi:MAG TPA: histidine kinase [Propionibacteriaceae bacterium]|nr:histidine kinase [Propionibacteriaceae bacterium]
MTTYEIVGADARPPWWRTAIYLPVVMFASLIAAVFSPAAWQLQHNGSNVMSLVAVLAMAASFGLPLLLLWRHRIPFVTTLAAAATSLLLPIGTALPLVGLATLIGRRRGRAVWLTAGAVVVTTVWVTVADALAQPRGASFLKQLFSAQDADPSATIDLGPAEVIVTLVVVLGLAVGAGLLVQWRRIVSSAESAVEVERAASGRLGDEVARRRERERIAREVRDSLGHRLSLLTLHAGALEANAGGDSRVAQSAHLVRESATAAMDDLRSLLAMLREPEASAQPPVPLSALASVVHESFGAGHAVSSSILIQDPDSADPALTRAVYRIVQELLTNARKHAPHEQVFLTVDGSPAQGIVIEARNRFIGGWNGMAPESRGLTGIGERAHLLGGEMRYGVDADQFGVRVALPWASG